MDDRQDDAILKDIEEKLFTHLRGFIDPEVIAVLENPDANQNEIEALKSRLAPEITGRLFSMANAAYSGRLRSGALTHFYDVVMRLGVEQTRLFVLFFSLPHTPGDRETAVLVAKSFARYVVAGAIFAREFRLNRQERKEVELGSLLYEVGKMLFASFRQTFPPLYAEYAIDDQFIDTNHRRLGITFCDFFSLPEYLKEIMATPYFTLEAELVSLSGMVMLTHFLVEAIFSSSGNRFVIQSPMPDPQDVLTYTTGAVIRDLFQAVGLSKFIVINTVFTTAQMQNLAKGR
ncbi:MAG: HDOD domain-containing protein [Pseudomonadota bacterium]|nr:HDOD domain-containing protein [Pseudomonadota bacterium]